MESLWAVACFPEPGKGCSTCTQRNSTQAGADVNKALIMTDVFLLHIPKCIWLLDYFHFTGESMVCCVKTGRYQSQWTHNNTAPSRGTIWFGVAEIKQNTLERHLLKRDTTTTHSFITLHIPTHKVFMTYFWKTKTWHRGVLLLYFLLCWSSVRWQAMWSK